MGYSPQAITAHNCRAQCAPGSYSVQRADDKAGVGDAAWPVTLP